jgi:23S rRNA pseudouridine1911/1915/1917 synthase
MNQSIEGASVVPVSLAGQRFDQIAAILFPEYSRSRLKGWIVQGQLRVDGVVVERPRALLWGGEQLTLQAEVSPDGRWQAETLPVEIIDQDEHIAVLNKPRGLVVHPGAGNPSGTLLNRVLYHFPECALVPRAGIVHRLDRDTSGLMVVAKTLVAQTQLVAALQAHTVTREYQAIVIGSLIGGGSVSQPIGRHPRHRTQMAIHPLGKPATTHYRILERFHAHTHLQLQLETGRTHQIRVHMASLNHPLVGDPLYGRRARQPKGVSADLRQVLQAFKWQALHATRLQLTHPVTGLCRAWQLPLPSEMERLLQGLRTDTQTAKAVQQW